MKKKISQAAAFLLSAAMLVLFSAAEYYSAKLPDSITVSSVNEVKIAEYPEISLCSVSADKLCENATLSLFGAVPVKKIGIKKAEPPVLAVGGQPFGIKLIMEGVMVTGLGNVESDSGQPLCPASECGIKVGDIVRSADGNTLMSNSQLQNVIGESNGRPLELSVEREGKVFTATLKPVYSSVSDEWKGGMWVRDSIAGIGTVTFVDKSSGRFGGLGHPICDSNTGGTVPVHSGEAVPVEITETKRGERGIPGELRGRFTNSDSLGSLDTNNEYGIFGQLSVEQLDKICRNTEEYPLGYRQDIKKGAAEIYTTVFGSTPQKYSIEIESIDYNSSDCSKNMKIKITDEKLLEISGGIVQGMSGSPVIQNGKIIGAVTHVFVSEPSCGYAVFADSMAEFTS